VVLTGRALGQDCRNARVKLTGTFQPAQTKNGEMALSSYVKVA